MFNWRYWPYLVTSKSSNVGDGQLHAKTRSHILVFAFQYFPAISSKHRLFLGAISDTMQKLRLKSFCDVGIRPSKISILLLLRIFDIIYMEKNYFRKTEIRTKVQSKTNNWCKFHVDAKKKNWLLKLGLVSKKLSKRLKTEKLITIQGVNFSNFLLALSPLLSSSTSRTRWLRTPQTPTNFWLR